MVSLAILLAFAQDFATGSSVDILSRVAEEAEVLQQNIPKALSTETLQQRTLLPPSRFRPRIGKAAAEPAKPRLQLREIVSESVRQVAETHFARLAMSNAATALNEVVQKLEYSSTSATATTGVGIAAGPLGGKDELLWQN